MSNHFGAGFLHEMHGLGGSSIEGSTVTVAVATGR